MKRLRQIFWNLFRNSPLSRFVDRTVSRANVMIKRFLKRPSIAFMVRVIVAFSNDNGINLAAGIAFYVLLTAFPLLLGIIAILGLFLSYETIQASILVYLESNIPISSDILEENIANIIDARTSLGLIGSIGFLWAGSGIFSALAWAINRAWGISQLRPFPIKKLREIIMALATSLLLLFSIGVNTLYEIFNILNIPFAGTLTYIGTRFLAFLFSLAIFLLIYKFIPNTSVYWKYIWPGALLGALFFEIGKNLFVFYIANFSRYDLVYGSISSIIVLLVWLYYSSIILIFFAEFSAEYNRRGKG